MTFAASVRLLPRLLAALALTPLFGCADGVKFEPKTGQIGGPAAAEVDARAERVRRDPKEYLRSVLERTRQLRQYTLEFTRYERRGLFQQLIGPERIECWFRRQPFSIRMKWLDPDVKYGESTFVSGQKDDKVRFIPRNGFLGLPPMLTIVDLQTPVTWGESKRPLTDFGLERLMERTLESMAEAGPNVFVSYKGLARLTDDGPAVHHLHLEYSDRQHVVPLQDLYIDALTELPAGTVLKFADGKVDAAYFYDKLNSQVELADDDFLLDAERAAPAAGK